MTLGSKVENQHDIRTHQTGRGKVQTGETHPNAKLTDAAVRTLWEDLKNKTQPLKDLAAKHGVSLHTLKDINRGRTWTHITGKNAQHHYKIRHARQEEVYMATRVTKRARADT